MERRGNAVRTAAEKAAATRAANKAAAGAHRAAYATAAGGGASPDLSSGSPTDDHDHRDKRSKLNGSGGGQSPQLAQDQLVAIAQMVRQLNKVEEEQAERAAARTLFPASPRVDPAASALLGSGGRLPRQGGEARCPRCFWVNRAGSSFCSKCGTSIAGAPPSAVSDRSSAFAHTVVTPAAPSATAASSGQPPTDTVKEEGLSKRDKELRRRLNEGKVHPSFALAPLSVEEALGKAAEAYGAVAYQAPSNTLIAVIQAGRLNEVGFALPIKVDGCDAEMDRADAIIALGSDSAAKWLERTTAPKVSSSAQFFRALTLTIIPSLITRPHAIIQWTTLAASVLQVEEERGWEAAAKYLRLTLSKGVAEAKSIAHSTAVLELVRGEFPIRSLAPAPPPLPPPRPNPPVQPQPPAQPQRSPGAGERRQQEYCEGWNRNGTCRFAMGGRSCKHLHICTHPACTNRDLVIGAGPSHPACQCPAGRGGEPGAK